MAAARLRLVFVALIATVFLGGAESAMAISGASLSDNAAAAQYPRTTTPSDILGDQDSGSDPDVQEDPGTEPDEQSDPGTEPDEQGATLPAAQVSAPDGGGSLPFTGLLAVPLLVAGAGMLAAGLVLRRRMQDPDGRSGPS